MVPNALINLIFVTLGCIPKLSFLDYVEVGKKDRLRVGECVGGWLGGARAYHYQGDFITNSGSSELSLDSEYKLEPSVAIKPYQTKLN